MGWEFGVRRCKLLYTEWMNNRGLLYSTGNCIQYRDKPEWKRILKNPCVHLHTDMQRSHFTILCLLYHLGVEISDVFLKNHLTHLPIRIPT